MEEQLQATDGHPMTTTQDGELVLPPEMWESVFDFLSSWELSQVRLVCCRFCSIVTDCPRLLRRFVLNLERPADLARDMDDRFRSWELLPVSEACIDNWDIVCVRHWWPEFGRNLTALMLFRCNVEYTLLLDMLENGTPNLRCFEMRAISMVAKFPLWVPDFQLPKLLKLTLAAICYDNMDMEDMLEAFTAICPKLQEFQMRCTPLDLDAVKFFLQDHQSTLEAVDVFLERLEDSLFEDFCAMRGQKLKRVCVDIREPFVIDDWMRLYAAQPRIECLTADVDRSSILCEVGQVTPTLMGLIVYMDQPMDTSFLDFFPHLEGLDINAYTSNRYSPLDIQNRRNEKLRVFRVFQMKIIGMMDYFQHCPKLMDVSLSDCILSEHVVPPMCLSNLQCLELAGCQVSTEILECIVGNSPQLETIKLGSMEQVNDSTMLMICQSVRKLRKLELECCCSLTDATADAIIEHSLALEQLKLYRNRLSPDAVERIRHTRNIHVWCEYYVGSPAVSFDWAMELDSDSDSEIELEYE